MGRDYAAFMIELANRMFADLAKAQEWFTRPHIHLAGRTPPWRRSPRNKAGQCVALVGCVTG